MRHPVALVVLTVSLLVGSQSACTMHRSTRVFAGAAGLALAGGGYAVNDQGRDDAEHGGPTEAFGDDIGTQMFGGAMVLTGVTLLVIAVASSSPVTPPRP